MQDISDNLGFLFSDISRLFRQHFQVGMEEYGLTLAQSRVLIHVARFDGIKQVDLADILEVRPMTLARLIDQLAKDGLVKRTADASDRRAHLVVLTEKAGPYLQSIIKVGSSVTQNVLGNFTPEEVSALQSALKKLRVNLCSL